MSRRMTGHRTGQKEGRPIVPKAGATTTMSTSKLRPSGGAFVGVDIGTQTIKVVEVKGSGGSLQITATGIANTPPGTIQQGVIADPRTLGLALKALLQQSGIKTSKSVSAAAGAAAVVVRVIELPKMTAAELRETMKWEVERHIPFPASDVEMSFQKIDDPVTDADPAKNMEVLLAVAQRDMINAHIETLRTAGLSPTVIDVEPLAVGRSLINLSRNDTLTKNVVVVNMGASISDVSIFKKGVLRFPRTIPLAGDNFTRAIADTMGLTMDAAEDEKRTNGCVLMDIVSSGGAVDNIFAVGGGEGDGMSSPFDVGAPLPPPLVAGGLAATAAVSDDNPFAINQNQNVDNPFALDAPAPEATASVLSKEPDDPRYQRRREVFNALFPVLGEFVMELRRSIDYFRSRYPDETVDQIILCGGSSRIVDLDKYMEYELGIPTRVADPLGNIRVTGRQLSVDKRLELSPSFAVAAGLASYDAVLGGVK
jgi:type IV pilus assembly protein PilM